MNWCDECGWIDHQEIPEDTIHCGCQRFHGEHPGMPWRCKPCACACHVEILVPR